MLLLQAGLLILSLLMLVDSAQAFSRRKPGESNASGGTFQQQGLQQDDQGNYIHSTHRHIRDGDQIKCDLGMTTGTTNGVRKARSSARDISSVLDNQIAASGCYGKNPDVNKSMRRISSYRVNQYGADGCARTVRHAVQGSLTPNAVGLGDAIQYVNTLPQYGFGNYINKYNENNAPDGAILVYKGVCPGKKNNVYGHVEMKVGGRYLSQMKNPVPYSKLNKCRKLAGVMLKKRIFEAQCGGK